MLDPVIKKEESTEASVDAMPPMLPAVSQIAPVSSKSDAEDLKLPNPRSYILERQSHLAPSAYHGSSPRKYKLGGRSNSSIRVSDRPPLPLLARLPSRATSAMATECVNKAIAKTTKRSTTPTPTPTLTLNPIHEILEHNNEHTKENLVTMDAHEYGDGDFIGNEMNFPVLQPVMAMQGECFAVSYIPTARTSQDEGQGLNPLSTAVLVRRHRLTCIQSRATRRELAISQGSIVASKCCETHPQPMSRTVSAFPSLCIPPEILTSAVTHHRMIMSQLVKLDQNLYNTVQQMETRVSNIEADTMHIRSILTSQADSAANTPLPAPTVLRAVRSRRARAASNARRSRSPSPARLEYGDRADVTAGEANSNGSVPGSVTKSKDLQVETSSPPPAAGLLTPQKTAVCFTSLCVAQIERKKN